MTTGFCSLLDLKGNPKELQPCGMNQIWGPSNLALNFIFIIELPCANLDFSEI